MIQFSLAYLIIKKTKTALDVVLLLGAVVLLKQSAEKERYRYIDEKNGYAGI